MSFFFNRRRLPRKKIRETHGSLRFFLSERMAVTQATCLLTSKVENAIYFEEKKREAQIGLAFLSPISCMHLQTMICLLLTQAIFLPFAARGLNFPESPSSCLFISLRKTLVYRFARALQSQAKTVTFASLAQLFYLEF